MFRTAVLLSVVCTGVGSAQVCNGEPSFGDAPFHFFGGGAVNGYFEFYNAGFLLGNNAVFGELGDGLWTYNTFYVESFVVSCTLFPYPPLSRSAEGRRPAGAATAAG